MCDFTDKDQPFVNLRQCGHGTVHLTVGTVTLHLSPLQTAALHKALCHAMPQIAATLPARSQWTNRISGESELN